MEVGLLEVQVGLGAVRLGLGHVVSDQLGLQALGELVVEFDLGVQDIGRGPSLGEGQACASVKHQQSRLTGREADLMSQSVASAERGTGKKKQMSEKCTRWVILVFRLDLIERASQR